MWRTLLLSLLFLLAVRAVMRLVGGIVQGATSNSPQQPARKAPVKMVADPVCGTFVVPGKALQLARGRETMYFCSDTCRDQWLASQ